MYHIPQQYGATDYSCSIDPVDIEHFREQCTFPNEVACDEDVFKFCWNFLDECNMAMPTNGDEGCEMYKLLRREIHSAMHDLEI